MLDCYSPEFPREAGSAFFTVEVNEVVGRPSGTVELQGRNRNEAAWATQGTFTNLISLGTTTKLIGELKEVLRFGWGPVAGQTGDSMRITIPTPVWQKEDAPDDGRDRGSTGQERDKA